MSDHIIRGMAANNQVRFFAGTTRDIVETARSIHNTSPVATAALGRLLTAGALMERSARTNLTYSHFRSSATVLSAD